MQRPAAVFVGSSSENKDLCGYLQAGLEAAVECEVTPWSSGVFRASSYTLESLVDSARGSDFAVLIVTPDDMVTSRGGEPTAAARDNVIFELGLFMGALGRNRTFIIADRAGVKLPSDLDGLTWLPYQRRTDGNQHAAMNTAVLGIAKEIRDRGLRDIDRPRTPSGASEEARLQREIQRLTTSVEAQGWRVRTASETTLRLVSRKGRRFTLSLEEDPRVTRERLRDFVRELRGHGLRVNQSLQRPVR